MNPSSCELHVLDILSGAWTLIDTGALSFKEVVLTDNEKRVFNRVNVELWPHHWDVLSGYSYSA